MTTPLTPPSPRALTDLVAYAEGSIVSRVLLKQKTGSVTLFAFDAGEGLSEHTSPFDALVLVTDGAARITVGGEDFHRSMSTCAIRRPSIRCRSVCSRRPPPTTGRAEWRARSGRAGRLCASRSVWWRRWRTRNG